MINIDFDTKRLLAFVCCQLGEEVHPKLAWKRSCTAVLELLRSQSEHPWKLKEADDVGIGYKCPRPSRTRKWQTANVWQNAANVCDLCCQNHQDLCYDKVLDCEALQLTGLSLEKWRDGSNNFQSDTVTFLWECKKCNFNWTQTARLLTCSRRTWRSTSWFSWSQNNQKIIIRRLRFQSEHAFSDSSSLD